MKRWLILSVVLLLFLAGLPVSGEPIEVTDEPFGLFIVSEHAGNTFYSDTTTNNTLPYQTRFYAYLNLSLYIVGKGLSYNVTLMDRNQSLLGNTTDNLTRLNIPLNGSSVWLVVFIGNDTYNFGLLGVTSQPSTVSTGPPPALTILVAEYLKREWRALLWSAGLAIVGLYACFLWITRYKRGKVIVR